MFRVMARRAGASTACLLAAGLAATAPPPQATPTYAAVSAQPEPGFGEAPPPLPPLRLPEPMAPVLRAPAGASASPQAPRPSALEVEVARLRDRAQAGGAGEGSRDAGRASWLLGLLYLHGLGVAASPADAAEWFERADALGEPLAAAGLAWCEIEGCRTGLNPAAARRWINQLRAIDLPRAQYLQWLMDTRLAPLQLARPGEPAPAASADRQLLLNAARGGNIHARIELGMERMAANRPAEALEQFRAVASRSSAASANVALLSEQLRSTRSARAPVAAAETLARARRNHRGEGQPANFVEAIRLYRLAQSQGSAEARKMLELIFSRPGPDGQVDITWMQQLAYVNLSGDVPGLDSSTSRRGLRREPTPLFDLVPPTLRR
jgi:TPR repeat protein